MGLAQRRIMWVILGAVLLVCSMTSGAVVTPTGNPVVQTALMIALILLRLAILAAMMIGVYQLAAALGASMTARVLYVIAMVVMIAWPSIAYILHRTRATPFTDAQKLWMTAGYAGSAVLSITAWWYGMRTGVNALEEMG